MAIILEDTGIWQPQKMDVQIAVIIVEHMAPTSAWQIVGSPLKPGIISTESICKLMES